ncbi:MAG: S1C family serine protease [Gaiellaceae bacterium]
MGANRNRIAIALCTAALAGGGAGAGAVALTHGGSSHDVTVPAPAADVANVASATLSVGQIAQRYSPGVVEVDATSTQQQNSSPFPFGGGSQESSAEGTGFVYDTKGDIVTNEHVIDGSSSVTVKLPDGTTTKATVVGSDISTDLAVLHVDVPASKLTVLSLGDSSKVSVGDGVVAIGNPFGLDDSVTSGIVSAVGREISAPDNTPIEGAIQTDAAINHGNSGGPLFDLQGKVIGITAQIQSESGGSDGVGFAIPSNTVRTVVTQLISTGKAQHALLGVTIKQDANGIGVVSVKPGTGAANGGIEAGDVITGVDGQKVTTTQRLREILSAHAPGDRLTISLLRSGSAKTVTVTLGSTTT